MIEHELGNYEYIELNKLLKFAGLTDTGGEANLRIEQGEVLVNGQVETQKRKKLRVGDKVTFANETIIVK